MSYLRGRDRPIDMRTIGATLILAGLTTSFASAQSHEVDPNELMTETQKASDDPDRMTVVWWMPEEYWALFQEQSVSEEDAEAFLRVLRPYVLLGVVDGTVGPLGGATFRTQDELRRIVTLVDGNGGIYAPLTDDRISPDARNLASMLEPVVTNMIGPMGENMGFFFFPATTADGGRIAVAAGRGRFSVKVGDQVFEWRTPLASLLPRKICPVDQQEMSGAWVYCPWHGEKLAPQE